MKLRATLSLALVACSLPAYAVPTLDQVTLEDGSTLSGKVQGIDAEGKLTIDSENTSKPIVLRGEALSAINFAVLAGNYPPHPQLLHLVNGDILPGELQSLDEETLRFTTWYAGELDIPRKFVGSVEYGVSPQNRVFFGPEGLADWIDNDSWDLEDGSLVCDTSGTIARPDTLPEQFILRFRIEWKNSPNFRLYFCDDHLKRHGKADRYYFEINSAGLQLKRENAEGDPRWFTLANSLRRPEEFEDEGFDVEIRVDRKRRLLYLYLDGEKLGRYPDLAEVPTGTGIMLQSQAGGDMKNIVPLIEVFEWDAVSQLRRSEGHEDPNTDAIVDVNGEHYSGRILRLDQDGDRSEIVLESAFADKPLTIKSSLISSLYFRDPPDIPKPSGQINFDLQAGGKLRLASLALGEESLRAHHPLLGDLELSRSALKLLTVTKPEPTPVPEAESDDVEKSLQSDE